MKRFQLLLTPKVKSLRSYLMTIPANDQQDAKSRMYEAYPECTVTVDLGECVRCGNMRSSSLDNDLCLACADIGQSIGRPKEYSPL